MTTLVSIRAALEARLAALTPALPLAWENAEYEPQIGTPYQRVALLPGQTENPSFAGQGTELVYEVGVFQVMLYYPTGVGPGQAAARADVLRAHFYRGLTMTAGGIVVKVARTPSIAPAMHDGDWYVVPVSVQYFSHVFA